jgi:hypothetical protein
VFGVFSNPKHLNVEEKSIWIILVFWFPLPIINANYHKGSNISRLGLVDWGDNTFLVIMLQSKQKPKPLFIDG